MIACLRNKEESRGMINGRRLLEESISLFDGKVNPIRCFSAREIEIATNYFDRSPLVHNYECKLYRCSLRDQEVLVKRFSDFWVEDYSIREIVVSSRMSVHKNTLKLIGCCLETEIVALVYESFDCAGTLHDELFRYSIESDPRAVLPWKHRLKIAVDLSNLVAYLHTALPRPLIHRYIMLSNILLDMENGVVKLFDFSACMPLPQGKAFVEDGAILGRKGYADPEYVETGRLNEKADVYGFGVMLLNLLSGQREHIQFKSQLKSLVFVARYCVDNERFEKMLDPGLSTDEPWPGKDGQFEAFLMLALECTRDRGFDRPDMTEVGTRLIGMYRSAFSDSNSIAPQLQMEQRFMLQACCRVYQARYTSEFAVILVTLISLLMQNLLLRSRLLLCSWVQFLAEPTRANYKFLVLKVNISQ